MPREKRHQVGILLTCGDEVLMMHRGMHKRLAPGLWAGVGGHAEPWEIGSPETTCLRELQEETGITADMVSGLMLMSIVVLMQGDGLSIVRHYAGTVSEKPALIPCDEGTLHWIRAAESAELPKSPVMDCVFRHWLESGGKRLASVRIARTGKITWLRLQNKALQKV